MIRFVEGVGMIGGLNWMPTGSQQGQAGLFGALLHDAAGTSRGAPGFKHPANPPDRGPRERDRTPTGAEAADGVPPLQPNDRRSGRADGSRHEHSGTSRESSAADRPTPRETNGTRADDTNATSRQESRGNRSERSASRETNASSQSSAESGATDAATRARAEGQTMATDPAALGTAHPAGGSSAASSIRLVAQPGGELGMSVGAAGSRGVSASADRQAAASRHTPADAEAVVRAASRGINSALAQRGGTITIRLIPETLGALRVQVEVDAGRVSVRIEASNTQAAELLHANAASLRQSLESRGMQVDRIVVSAPSTDPTRQTNANDPNRSDPESQDQQEHAAHDQPDADARQRHKQDSPATESGTTVHTRSPMERFGERLRLILDGIG